MYKKILILVSVLFLLSGKAYTQCYELLWSDEFNYTGLPDPEFWSFEEGGGGWGNNELQYYKVGDTANSFVENGTLTINALKESYGGRDYTSARIVTRGKFNVRYGKIEARMRLPYGQGIWPAFWAMGENISEVGWPACGEIDIMEMIGGQDRDNTVHGTVHWEANGSHASYGKSYTLESGIFADDFHTFSVEWTPTSIKWFVDDIQYNVINIEPADLSEFHQDFFILLNLAVGGNWPGNPDAGTVFPQTLEVDYVRVYKESEDIENELSIYGDSLLSQLSADVKFNLPSSSDWNYSWSVPQGAEITSGQGTSSISVNWGCEEGPVNVTATGSCGTYSFSRNVAVENKIYGPLFIDEQEENLLFYTDSLAGSSIEWSVPEDVDIVAGQGSDSLWVNWGSMFENVVLKVDNVCGTYQLEYPVTKTGQYPYPDINNAHSVPGTIEAVEYDYGGEGEAYHDLSAGNEGPGPRQENDVDTEYGDNGEPNVGWISGGEWLEYTISVDSASYYRVNMRVATNNASGGPFSVQFNAEELLSGISVQNTGGWASFQTIEAGVVYLTEQDTLMRINFDYGGFNLGKIIFTPTDKPSSTGKDMQSSVKIFPVPANESVNIKSAEMISSWSIHDINGRKISQTHSLSTSELQLDISDYPAGVYFITLNTADGFMHVNKILKK